MYNIVLARIDDRLIHGQVITAWVKHVNADTIIIIDGVLAKNKMMQRIYVASAPSGIELKILSLDDFLTYINNLDSFKKILLLAKVPQVFETLINEGIMIDHVILGGMGSNGKRQKLIRNAYADDDEKQSMRNMMKKGIEVTFQLVPDEKSSDLSKLI